MRFFELSIQSLVLRFYLMMAVVIAAGFSGLWPLALLAVPIFLSCMTAIAFGRPRVAVDDAVAEEVARERDDVLTHPLTTVGEPAAVAA